jgi:hypothetical protein
MSTGYSRVVAQMDWMEEELIDWIKKVFEKGMPNPDNGGPDVDKREYVGLNCFTSSEIASTRAGLWDG